MIVACHACHSSGTVFSFRHTLEHRCGVYLHFSLLTWLGVIMTSMSTYGDPVDHLFENKQNENKMNLMRVTLDEWQQWLVCVRYQLQVESIQLLCFNLRAGPGTSVFFKKSLSRTILPKGRVAIDFGIASNSFRFTVVSTASKWS